MSHNAIIAQADKGKTVVIIYQQDYNSAVHNFLIENDIKQTHKNPVNKDENNTRSLKTMQSSIQQPNKISNSEEPNTTKTKRTNQNTQTQQPHKTSG
jgi:hypothetical protein